MNSTSSAGGPIREASDVLAKQMAETLGDDILQLRSRWRSSLQHSSILRDQYDQTRQEYTAAMKSAQACHPAPNSIQQLQSLHERLENDEKALADAEEESKQLESQVSRLDLALMQHSRPQDDLAHIDASVTSEISRIVAGGKKSPSPEPLPAELQELFSVLGEIRLMDETLTEILPSEHSEQQVERERLQDQGVSLPDSDDAFQAKMRKELEGAEELRKTLSERAGRLYEVCVKAGHDVDPSNYSKAKRLASQTVRPQFGVSEWIRQTANANPEGSRSQPLEMNAEQFRGRSSPLRSQVPRATPAVLEVGDRKTMENEPDSKVSSESLTPNFQKQKDPRRFFKVGRVFMTLWTEPASFSSQSSAVSTVRYGQAAFSAIRRFVVIREGSNYCTALPTTTYGGSGVAKPGVVKSEHAIIYTGSQPPHPIASELERRREAGMQPIALQVIPDDPGDRLDPRTRIHFGKTYTIEFNLKVRSFGMVRNIDDLQRQFAEVMSFSAPAAVPSTPGLQPPRHSDLTPTFGAVVPSMSKNSTPRHLVGDNSAQQTPLQWSWSESLGQYYYTWQKKGQTMFVTENGRILNGPAPPTSQMQVQPGRESIPRSSSEVPYLENAGYRQQQPSVLPAQSAQPAKQVNRSIIDAPPHLHYGAVQSVRGRHGVEVRTAQTSQGEVILGTPGDAESLDPAYKRRNKPREFFKIGKVFFTLWTEPTMAQGAASSSISIVRYGERVYSQIKRFVVLREGSGYCIAAPILTYGGRGVSKAGVAKHEHAIIYTGRQAPSPMPSETPGRGETPMLPQLIQVDPSALGDSLDPRSRVNLGTVATVAHNLKVKPFGMVRNINDLMQAYIQCRDAPARVSGAQNVHSRPAGRPSRGPAYTYVPSRDEPGSRSEPEARATQRAAPVRSARKGLLRGDSGHQTEEDDSSDESDDEEEEESDSEEDVQRQSTRRNQRQTTSQSRSRLQAHGNDVTASNAPAT